MERKGEKGKNCMFARREASDNGVVEVETVFRGGQVYPREASNIRKIYTYKAYAFLLAFQS